MDRHGATVTSKCLAALLGLALCEPALLYAQSSGQTVRHHRVVEEDTSQQPELAQAETAIEKQDYAAAEPLLLKAVAAAPTNYVAWFDLGFVYHRLDRDADAIAAYRKSVAAKPDVFESNLNLGRLLAETKQADAAQFLRAATQLKPTDHVEEGQARAWLTLGHVVEASDPEKALEAYRQAASLQPKDTEPLLSMGPLLENQKRYADAEQAYKQVLAIDPQSGDALAGLANIYMRGNRFPEAEQVLRKLAAQRPSDSAVHTQLGRMLAMAGKNDDAIAELQKAQKIAPNDTGIQLDLAELYTRSSKFDLAEIQYESLLKADPKNAELHNGLGELFLKQRNFHEAQQEFLNAITLKPDFGAAYGNLAAAASENKNYPLVLKALDERAKYMPENPATYFFRATAYDHLRDVKQAAENYHRFLDVANGKYPDQEWQAKHRLIALQPKK